MFGTARTKSD